MAKVLRDTHKVFSAHACCAAKLLIFGSTRISLSLGNSLYLSPSPTQLHSRSVMMRGALCLRRCLFKLVCDVLSRLRAKETRTFKIHLWQGM